MIVWTGKGILIALVVFISIAAFRAILPHDLLDYGFAFGFFIGAIFSFYFGYKWNGSESERVFIDEKTGEKIRVKNSHTLFWIKMEYWGYLLSIFGIIILFRNSIWVGLSAIVILVIVAFTFFSYIKKKNETSEKKINEIFNSIKTQNVNEISNDDKIEKTNNEDDLSRYMPKSDKIEK